MTTAHNASIKGHVSPTPWDILILLNFIASSSPPRHGSQTTKRAASAKHAAKQIQESDAVPRGEELRGSDPQNSSQNFSQNTLLSGNAAPLNAPLNVQLSGVAAPQNAHLSGNTGPQNTGPENPGSRASTQSGAATGAAAAAPWWTPLCLPESHPSAFRHVYIAFPIADSPLFVAIAAVNQAAFFDVHAVHELLVLALEASGALAVRSCFSHILLKGTRRVYWGT